MKTPSTLLFRFHFIIVILYTLLSVSANAQNLFYKAYGTVNIDDVFSLDNCSDGGYYITGQTNTAPFRSDAFIARTDALGTILWEKIIQFDSTSVHYSGAGMLSDESMVLFFTEYSIFP